MPKIVTKAATSAPTISEDVSAMLTAFQNEHGRKTSLSINDIQTILDAHKDEEEIDADAVLQEMVEAEQAKDDRNKGGDKPKPVAVRDQGAMAIAAKLAKDDILVKDIGDFVRFKEGLKRLPAAIAHSFTRDLTPDEIAGLPEPGSTKQEGKNTTVDNRGVGKGSFYGDLWEGLPGSDDVLRKIADLSTSGDDRPEWVQKIHNAEELRTEKALWNSRKTNGIGAVRNAARLLKKMNEVKDKLDLRVSFLTEKKDGKDVVKRTTFPILVYRPAGQEGQPQQQKYMSVGAFLAVKVDVVAKKEDHFAAFDVERKPRGKDKEVATVTLKNANQGVQAIYELVGIFSNDRAMADVYSIVTSDEGGEFLDSVFQLEKELHRMTIKPELQAKVRAYREAKAKADGVGQTTANAA